MAGRSSTTRSGPATFVLDLSSCDREPIHIPGAIQSHGILFAMSGPELRVTAVSANVLEHLGIEPKAVLGRPIAELIDAASFLAVKEAAAQRDEMSPELVHVRLHGKPGSLSTAAVHGTPDRVLLEIKLPQPFVESGATGLFHRYNQATRRLRNASDVVALCQALAEEIRILTGYDRVKVYRFAQDWSGEVIAEAKTEIMPSFLGLHFPATDIPVQARELYRRNPERQIPDIGYLPVPLMQTGPDPIDLSAAALRSVSPIHIEYLSHMGVGASMSVSILRHDQLWGLVACHHGSPRYVPPELRQASVLLAQLVAWQLTFLEEADTVRRSLGVKEIETTLLHETSAGRDYQDALLRHSTELLELLQASGMAITRGTSLTTLGETPPPEPLRDLLGWLSERGPDVFETDHLAAHYLPAADWADAAGILAVPLGGVSNNLMVWFRPEIARTVTWAGNPEKPAEPSGVAARMSPRLSFAAWTEAVRGRSRPWERHEVAAANSLRDMVADIILRRSLELEEMNAKLMRSNDELQAFAYVASHDLKEPLRQIETFSTLLERLFKDTPPSDANAKRWFEGIQGSSRRLRTLIDDLAEYSRLGRHANPFAPCALDAVLEEVKADLGGQIERTAATIRSGPLPVIMCDHTQMRQVMQNLISNALKYRHPNRSPEITIDAVTGSGRGIAGIERLPVLRLSVTDNGIGFEERHRALIFEPFQRLHSTDDYEGSGIGLAICRKIIDRHGGAITATSRPDEGSVFIITMPMRPIPNEQVVP
jgi:chemotaxis family two-component system sensor kinase Cph1